MTHIGGAAYAATKHAAVGFAEWLAITYGDRWDGCASCVCPMGVDTQLLRSTRQSWDATEQLAARSIMNTAEVISPERVAKRTLDACRRGDFLVLPHPEVREMYQTKSTDHDQLRSTGCVGIAGFPGRARPLSDFQGVAVPSSRFLAAFKWTVLTVVAASAVLWASFHGLAQQPPTPSGDCPVAGHSQPRPSPAPTLMPYGRDLGAEGWACGSHELRN